MSTLRSRGQVRILIAPRHKAVCISAGFEPVVEIAKHCEIARIDRVGRLIVNLMRVGFKVEQLLETIVVFHVFAGSGAHAGETGTGLLNTGHRTL
jgi:hypothetical protein